GGEGNARRERRGVAWCERFQLLIPAEPRYSEGRNDEEKPALPFPTRRFWSKQRPARGDDLCAARRTRNERALFLCPAHIDRRATCPSGPISDRSSSSARGRSSSARPASSLIPGRKRPRRSGPKAIESVWQN